MLAQRAVDANPRLRAAAAGDSTGHTLAIDSARQLHALFRQARTGAARRTLRPD
jgi:hypothetical protein